MKNSLLCAVHCTGHVTCHVIVSEAEVYTVHFYPDPHITVFRNEKLMLRFERIICGKAN